jgi:hypothetical protein
LLFEKRVSEEFETEEMLKLKNKFGSNKNLLTFAARLREMERFFGRKKEKVL